MKYDLHRLNNVDFELMSQSIFKKIIGNGTVTFGQGPDGGREATYVGKADFPNNITQWDGYWVMQAKYRNVRTSEEAKDFNWLRKEIYKELNKYSDREVLVKKPDNLIFFTNIILTPTAETGGRDQANKLIDRIQADFLIKHVEIVSYDDINTYLDSFRDIATSFSSFILPGDILNELLHLLNKNNGEKKLSNDYLGMYLEIEFKNDMASRLEHAGKLTSSKINLEKVFIDLHVTGDGSAPNKSETKFVQKIIDIGNILHRVSLNRNSRYVLIAGPGYGKSTLTQFLCQIYRAYFLKNIDLTKTILPEVDSFLNECNKYTKVSVSCIRFPIKITLKDYANWIIDQDKNERSHSLIAYISSQINKRCETSFFDNEKVEEIISKLSCLFILDGLDEVPRSSNRDEVIKQILHFTDHILRRLDVDSLIIATSRPQGYTEEFDKTIYRHLYITDLEKDDCLLYIEKLLYNIENHTDKRTEDFEILRNALDDTTISRLMKTPLQASIMTILVGSGGEPPRNKYDLFSEYYSTIFRREKQKKVLKVLSNYTDYIKRLHNKLGFTLQVLSESTKSPSATITTSDFESFIHIFLEKDMELPAPEIENISASIKEALIERLIFIEEVQDGLIGFNIRSFQEYFAANYYLDQPDSELLHSIRKISKPSYWNNTLMFSVGYLLENKSYAISYVESICNELNGSIEPLNTSSLPSICSQGSWIALDILNETIFRNQPRYENIFSRLIESLIRIPIISLHTDLIKLPINIKNNFLFKYLTEGIKDTSQEINNTSWCIAFLFIVKGYPFDIETLEEAWLNYKGDKLQVIDILSKRSLLEGEFSIRIYQEELLKVHKLDFYRIIIQTDTLFLREVVKRCNSKEIISKILLSLFIRYFYDTNSDRNIGLCIYEMYKKIHIEEDVKNFDYYFDTYNEDFIKFNIIENVYTGKIEPFISVIDKNRLNNLFILVNHFDVPLIKSLITFYMNPSKNTLVAFVDNLLVISDVKIDFLPSITNLNWLFRKLFHGKERIEDVAQDLKQGLYGDLDDWIGLEAYYNYITSSAILIEEHLSTLLEVCTARIIETPGKAITILNGFLNLRKSFTNNVLIDKEFLTALNWISSSNDEDVNNLIDQNEDFQKQLLYAFENSYYKTNYFLRYEHYLCILIRYISRRELMNQHEKIEAFFKKVKIYKIIELTEVGFDNRVFEALRKIIDLYPFFNMLYQNSSIIRLVPYILTNQNVRVSIVQNIDFNIQNLNLEKIDENHFALCTLLIMSFNESEKFKKIVREIISTLTLSEMHVTILLDLIYRFSILKNVEEILLDIEKGIKNYEERSTYISIIKNCVASQASGINLNNQS